MQFLQEGRLFVDQVGWYTIYLQTYCTKGNYILYTIQTIFGFTEANPNPWALAFQNEVSIWLRTEPSLCDK